MNILVTRPEPDGTALAGRLQAMGHDALVEPLMETVFCHAGALPVDGVQGVIATSRNGLRALEGHVSRDALTKLPLFAVGEATAALGRDLGFTQVHTGKGGALDLLPLIEEQADAQNGALLHLSGETLAVDLKGALEAKGFTVLAPVVYDMRAAEKLSQTTVSALKQGQIDGVILLSPRTARLLLTLTKSHGLEGALRGLTFFCLSTAVSQALEDEKNLRIRIAAEPKLEEILALVNLEAAHLP